jgi:hypothetical protein
MRRDRLRIFKTDVRYDDGLPENLEPRERKKDPTASLSLLPLPSLILPRLPPPLLPLPSRSSCPSFLSCPSRASCFFCPSCPSRPSAPPAPPTPPAPAPPAPPAPPALLPLLSPSTSRHSFLPLRTKGGTF